MSKIVDELGRIDVESAELFISIAVHRRNGLMVPTMTVFGEKQYITADQYIALRAELVSAMRKILGWREP